MRVDQGECGVTIRRQLHGVSKAVDAKKQRGPRREEKVLDKSFEDVISDFGVGGTEEGELVKRD